MKIKEELVSIVIPVFNEEKVIERLLLSLKNQTYRNIEVIVVDDGSSDRTVEIASKYADKVYKRKHAERSVQRNFGVKKSKGKLLLFLDGDMKLSEDVVLSCVNLAKKDRKAGAIAIKEIPVASTFWEKVKAFERSFYNIEGDDITDAARFFPKHVFNEIGGYDETITGPEDWDITDEVRRIGLRVRWVDAVIYHYERVPNPIILARKKYYYGLKSYRYFKKHKIRKFGPKTIYFLRPVFYKHPMRFIRNPFLSVGLLIMLTFELIGGGLGYFWGRIKNE